MDLSPRPCSICGEPRPVSRRSRPVVTCQACRRGVPKQTQRPGSAGGLNCADCGKAMWNSRTSLPQGLARCLPCRREAPTRIKRRGNCHRCGVPVPAGTRRWKYCTEECFRKTRNARGSGAKANTAARGYDHAHQVLRAKLLPLAYGHDCPLCGLVMNHGDELHLDHNEDRSGYRGMTHAACNVLDGARRGGQAMRMRRLEAGWRPGQDPSTRRRRASSAA